MKVVVWGARLGLVLGAFGVGDAMAQQQPPSAPAGGAASPARIAFVNGRAALTSMPGYAKAESTYMKEGEAAQMEMRKMQATIDSAVADFEQQQAMLSATNRATRRKELETKNEQLQTRAREIQQRMGQRERELLQPMQERLSAIIDGIRAENNYTMIIDLGVQGLGILTYDKSLDITQRVVARLRQTN
jgi:Skp family chaperone for outer membrane proteins